MPTTITKTIGTASRDYSTVQAWEDNTPADLVAVDQIWSGECYNDAEFLVAGGVVTIGGATVDATRFVQLTAAAGQSFIDNANIRTNALRYNQANGVGLRSSNSYTPTITVSTRYTKISRLQVQGANLNVTSAVFVTDPVPDVEVRNCILDARNVVTSSADGFLVVNCLMHARGAGTIIGVSSAGNQRFEYCTMIRETHGGNPGGIGFATLTAENCAIFNFTDTFQLLTLGVVAGGHNATDFTSAPGTANQVSLTYADQFESTTNDWRAKVGGSLVNGVSAPTYATADIGGFTRGATPTIGAWELPATGPSGSPYYAQQQQ